MLPHAHWLAALLIHRIAKLFTDSVDIVSTFSITRTGRVLAAVCIRWAAAPAEQIGRAGSPGVFAQRRPGLMEPP
jgi:hypothetical protein